MTQLLNYLKQHSITVLSNTDHTITVEAVYSKDGVAFTEPETIPATMQAVRDWLGY